MILGRSIYQIALGLVAAGFAGYILFRYLRKEGSQTFFKFAASFFIWAIIFTFALFPEVPHVISKTFGLGDNLNTLIFAGFVLVFVIIFKLLNLIERLERNISEIIRKEALSKLKDNTK